MAQRSPLIALSQCISRLKSCLRKDDQWKMAWQLWIRYFNMGPVSIYEGERASQIFNAGAAV